ncbi:hypothetical protein F4553_000417 [Allocatelliglobosispora scoriae]|uniref:Cation/H+ exchanger domain-containing protein n=1 Tax=Allocatelliglobosispora scoriae TaxID=643052 RepID=A0A841BI88_9ACTN|nr:hypothetical protein [Allocatelliglobosispora scoriae]MBB5867038.1 hypothetical protein [Allocatelliglobosispora scoriae]
MRRFAALIAAVGLGAAIAWVTGLHVADLPDTAGYLVGTAALLAIGLYGSTYGIDLPSARQDGRLIATAVTVGVVAKAALIGTVLALAWQDPLFLLLGVVVAQIDPLSVAALMGDDRMTPRAKTILAAWSSFDDPVTVILTVYVAAIALDSTARHDPLSIAADLALNLAFAAVAWLVWRLVRTREWAVTALVALAAGVAVWQLWMLGLALVGLFARPRWLDRWLPRLTTGALLAAAVLVGVLLTGLTAPIALVQGATLGLAAFTAQIAVGWLLTKGLPRQDRWHLALAQQNGITAIILALRLESTFTGIAAIVAPAIVATNLTHAAVNRAHDHP